MTVKQLVLNLEPLTSIQLLPANLSSINRTGGEAGETERKKKMAASAVNRTRGLWNIVKIQAFTRCTIEV
jgi:hypothetical protein